MSNHEAAVCVRVCVCVEVWGGGGGGVSSELRRSSCSRFFRLNIFYSFSYNLAYIISDINKSPKSDLILVSPEIVFNSLFIDLGLSELYASVD